MKYKNMPLFFVRRKKTRFREYTPPLFERRDDMIKPIPRPHAFRSNKYLDFIRSKRCIICGNPETVAHHESLGRNAMGSKPPDHHAVPLCVNCHNSRHNVGARIFWTGYDVKMIVIDLIGEYLTKGDKR